MWIITVRTIIGIEVVTVMGRDGDEDRAIELAVIYTGSTDIQAVRWI